MEETNCGETIDVIDRISALPDAVRAHILSFLSTKEAVGTCVLSKGWKNAWSSVPVLRFDLKEFLPDRSFPDKQKVCEAKLKRFVKGVLKNRDSSHIEKFELLWNTARCTYGPIVPGTSEHVEGCVLPAMRFKPRVLSVSLPKYKLPNFKTNPIFSCESLQDVLLKFNFSNGYFRIAPTTVHLPFLKKLYLSGVILCDDFANKIFMGCPVLEELSLSYCDLKVSNISSSTLKKLFLLDCHAEQNWEISTRNLLNWEISTPNLLNLEISTPYPFGYKNIISLNKMVSLLNARIRSSFNYNFTNGEPKFLGFLSNVAKLELSLNDAQVKGLLEKEVPNCPIFNHLKILILSGWCMSLDFELVAFFLRSPNLQRLTLHPFDNVFLLPEKMSSQEVARGALFQREQLDNVKIIRRGKEEWIDRLVNILHSHVKIIGKIIITYYNWERMRN